ncbi:TonB-dependent receptor [Psychrosphaera aquimarina]|uniref:TonB-dependent receptor n=1 Tax=Psychrosphaera aquimarina TaxID=2044854 RepID=A0ABU3R0L4_9GAMM|nr:TonB-dependent receptor [Psychrosphaera aquimarina]MDU0113226.1 TonB-dependent receptor [Psychrosphaera aquimarina]
MNNLKKQKLSILIASILASGAAYSADEVEKEKKDKEDIMERIEVSASGRVTSAAELPMNITAMGSDELRRKNITDIKDLIAESVAISAPGNSNRFADSVTVRGLNVANVNANNIERFATSTLAYYLDATPLPNIAYRIKDIKRVETLLGPQGTLYGGGSLGGTVRYITNKPELEEFTVDFNSSVYQVKEGSLSHDTDVVVNVPLTKSVALRASLARLDDGGFTDRMVNPVWLSDGEKIVGTPNPGQELYEDDDWEETTSARVQLLWQVNDDLSVNFSHINQTQLAHGTRGASRWDLDEACAAENLSSLDCKEKYSTETAPLQFDEYTIQSVHEEYSDRDFALTSVDIDWNLGFATLTSSLSTYDDARIGQGDYLYEGFTYYGTLAYMPSLRHENTDQSAYIRYDNTYKGFTHESRLTSNGDGPFSWIAGIFNTSQDKSLQFWEVFPGFDDAAVSDYGGFDPRTEYPDRGFLDSGYYEDITSEYTETAVYGEISYKILPEWTVTAGARFFDWEDSVLKNISDYTGYLGIDIDTSKDGGSDTIFKFNTSYNFNESSLAYFTVSQGFRRGGTNGFRDEGDDIVAGDTQRFAPDTTTNKELGIKATVLDNQLYLQAAFYQIDWHDTQTYFDQTIKGFPINGTVNGPDAQTNGYELSGRYRINDNFTIKASYAATEAEFTETKTVYLFEDNLVDETQTWTKGEGLGGTPKSRQNLSINYYDELGDGSVDASLSVRFVGKQLSSRQDTKYDDELEQEIQVDPYIFDAYNVMNLSAGYSQDDWSVSVFVDNLTDELGESSYQRVGGSWGHKSIYIMPRTVGVTFSYNYF